MNATRFLPVGLAVVLLVPQHAAGQCITCPCPLDTAFTYQGFLTCTNNPGNTIVVNGDTDVEFRLYDCDMDGAQLGPTLSFTVVNANAIDVQNGDFTVILDFGDVYDGDKRWLEITLLTAPGACAGILPIVLSPRQELTSVPHAIFAPNASGGGGWVDDGSVVRLETSTDRVGIGTMVPGEKLDVDGNIHASGTITSGNSITIDGLTDTITASSATIGFDDENLTTTGMIESTVAGFKFPDGTVQTTAGTGGQWIRSGEDIFYTDGRVGIGTTVFFPLNAALSKLSQGTTGLACATTDLGTGKIYCFGGINSDQIVEYDAPTDTLTSVATLESKREGLACCGSPTNSKIYCFGGIDAPNYVDHIVEYDPGTNTQVKRTAVLPHVTFGLSCATDSDTGYIYLFGGHTTDGAGYLDEILEYDPGNPDQNPVTKTAVLPFGRQELACAPVTGKIYCLGGRDGPSAFDQIVEYDPDTDTLVTMDAVLPSPRQALACAPAPGTGKIYCFGGGGLAGPLLDEIVEYDPTIPDVPDPIPIMDEVLPSPRNSLACTAELSTARIYCFGGSGTDEIVEYLSPTDTRLQVGQPGDGTRAMANSWSVFSSRAFKRDIEPLSPADYHDILGKLEATDVVRYRYIRDARQTLHLGVIAEDSPAEILAPGGKAVSLGDYAAFLLAAIKAQQIELAEKDCRIDGIALELADTQARLRALEELMANLTRAEEGGAR